MMNSDKVTIVGAGSIGCALAKGLTAANLTIPGNVTLTRRQVAKLDDLAAAGYVVTDDNPVAVRSADIVVVAVEPQDLDEVLDELAPAQRFLNRLSDYLFVRARDLDALEGDL